MERLSFLLISLTLSVLLPPPCAQADDASVPGTIDRTTKQQVIATVAPDDPAASQPFLTSHGGKYSAYFLRHATTPGAGGFGNDFCYVEVEDTGSGESVWESECAPVSTSNACSLVFTDSGLEVFDGSSSAWTTNAGSAGNNPLQTLELVDEGDMRIRDNRGELAWKASDEPRQNQQCGQPGSPGLAPARPPFAQPIGGGTGMPFGQQQSGGPGQAQAGGGGREEHGEGGVGEAFGLVDSTPYDSGSCRGVAEWVGLGSGWVLSLLASAVLI